MLSKPGNLRKRLETVFRPGRVCIRTRTVYGNRELHEKVHMSDPVYNNRMQLKNNTHTGLVFANFSMTLSKLCNNLWM